jgi:hypothetical protein
MQPSRNQSPEEAARAAEGQTEVLSHLESSHGGKTQQSVMLGIGASGEE